MKYSKSLLFISTILLFTAFILINGCSKGFHSSKVDINTDHSIRVVAFDEQGKEDVNLTKLIEINQIKKDFSQIVYSVSINGLNNASTSYLEVRYNPSELSPTDVSFGSLMQSSNRGVLTCAPLNHSGVVPVAQVLIGKGQGISGSGELAKITFSNTPFQRTTSTYKQKDKVVQNITYTASTNTLEWDCFYRSDANTNLKVDFADFGVVGLNYNKDVSTDITISPSDCNNNGKVDFADFGSIGLAYGDTISLWMFWFSETSPVDYTVAKVDGKDIGNPDLTVTNNAYGFKHFSISTFNLQVDLAIHKYALIAPADSILSYYTFGEEVSLSGGGGAMNIPTNVQASDAAYNDKIVITWDKVYGATGYVIYRDTEEYALTIVADVNYYEDFSVPDTNIHTYWVKATNGVLTSEKSATDTGQRLP